jgi:hypothetical protein
MRCAWSAATGGPDRPAAADPRQREACCTSAGGLGGSCRALAISGSFPNERRPSGGGPRRSKPAQQAQCPRRGGRVPANAGRVARSPDGDHRVTPEGTRDEAPAAVSRSAPGRAIGPARLRTAACGTARPQRAKPRGLRGWRCAAACSGPTRPRHPVATTGPARPSRGRPWRPGHGRAEGQLWRHRTLVDRGSAESAPGLKCLAVTGPLDPETGHVVSSSGQRDRTAEVRPRGATQPRT